MIYSRSFTCGHCSHLIASNTGFQDQVIPRRVIHICPHCGKPTFFDGAIQVPGVAPGGDVEALPEGVAALYKEARNCVAANASTAAVLVARKLLAHIAVEQGAAENLKFIEYVDHLAAKGFVPPNGRVWVDHIRKKGNEATHEIVIMTAPDATELLTFLEMLLKFIYEFPAMIPSGPIIQPKQSVSPSAPSISPRATSPPMSGT